MPKQPRTSLRESPGLTDHDSLETSSQPAGSPDQEPYYLGYHKRYQKVYAAGAQYWETTEPNEPVQQIVPRLSLSGRKVIDLGAGEGRDTIYLARQGYDVTAVDISAAALAKGRQRARQEGLTCRFVEDDVLSLKNFGPAEFDLALDMGCLHMLVEPTHRAQYLRRVYEILKPGGSFLIAHCREKWLQGFFSVPHYDEVVASGPIEPGRVIERRIRVKGGTQMLPLPLVPFKEASEEAIGAELERAGFQVVKGRFQTTYAFGHTAIVPAIRPSA